MCLDVFATSDFFKAIKRMLDVRVREAPFDAVKSLLGAEWHVVDLEWIIQLDALLHQQVDHITERMMSDVEISGYALHLEESFKAASLSIVKLF